MPSFQISIKPGRRAAARFVTGVRRKILQALEEENEKRGLKQTDVARTIGVHRSMVNRELRGKKDLKLGRIAEYAYALGRVPLFDLPEDARPLGSNLPTPAKLSSSVPPENARPKTSDGPNVFEMIEKSEGAPVPVV
jgi:transcriptional regulator with XRE-family HTH domain